ncbi:MAG TPA: hypothetical protein DCE65_02240 [Clostridiales bacterium]|nr:hypothetical protein [Clostridiales bacterium]
MSGATLSIVCAEKIRFCTTGARYFCFSRKYFNTRFHKNILTHGKKKVNDLPALRTAIVENTAAFFLLFHLFSDFSEFSLAFSFTATVKKCIINIEKMNFYGG